MAGIVRTEANSWSMAEEAVLVRVLDGLRAHPHDDTPAAIADHLGDISPPRVETALRALDGQGLVHHAAGHWQPTLRGWRVGSRRAA